MALAKTLVLDEVAGVEGHCEGGFAASVVDCVSSIIGLIFLDDIDFAADFIIQFTR